MATSSSSSVVAPPQVATFQRIRTLWPSAQLTDDEMFKLAHQMEHGPIISPPQGRYEWNQATGGGVLITFPSYIEKCCNVHWKVEWLRVQQKEGCKFQGHSSDLGPHPDTGVEDPDKEEWTANFRIQPHRLGYMRRKAGEDVMIELNYPGRFNVEAWLIHKDNDKVVTPVTSRLYEVVNIGGRQAAAAG